MLRLLSLALQTGGLVFILLLSLVLVTVQRALALVVSTSYWLYWCRSDGKTHVPKLAEKWTKGGRL